MRIAVGDGYVELVDQMGSDLSVVNAARVSFNSESEHLTDKDRRLMKYLWDNNHSSPFRHATLQFRIKAPLMVLRQWMKHQVGCSWNERSGRYTKFDLEFYTPENWRQQHKSNKQGSEGSIEAQERATEVYETTIKACFRTYEYLLNMGVAKEQARMLLPLALYTECVWTTSLQATMHFLKLRMDSHAQKEIQDYAEAIAVLVMPHFQETLKVMGINVD
jgi:thymidylate synthase (FAD)